MKRFNVFVIVLLVSQHALCVEVYEGAESVLLPCSPNVSPVDGVLWKRSSSIVHARKQNGDDLGEQDQRYVNRTSMRSDAPQSGDLSLILTKPSINNSDNYTCIARFKGQDLNRTLVPLMVRGPVETEPSSVLVKVLVPLGVIVVLAIIFFCWKKRRDREGRHESYNQVNLEPLSTSVQQVEVESGAESVQLPFETTNNLSEGDKVEWMDKSHMKVHVYQNMSEQHQDYRGRTDMSEDPLRTGDLSLTLKHPTVRDSNTYSCTISRDGQVLWRKQVELQVKVLKVEVESGAESVQLPFETTEDLPEDSYLKWLLDDPEQSKTVHVFCIDHDVPEDQHQDYRGRTQMNEDPLTTGDLSLTLRHPTVRDNNTYCCRVFQQGLHFLREKTVQLEVKDEILGEDETINNRRSSFTDPTPLMADQSDQ